LLTHPTLDQLHRLGLAGTARAFTQLDADPRAVELSHAEWLGLLLDREMTERQDRRLKARLRFARLRHQAIIENVDYRPLAASTAPCSKTRHLRVAARPSPSGGRRTDRHRKVVVGLCPRPPGLPQQPVRSLSAHS